jgi:hypothetical protein
MSRTPPRALLPGRVRSFLVKAVLYRRRPAEALAYGAAERAALALRQERLATSPSARPRVVFLISVVGQARARDWASVSVNLFRTLRALQRQTDPGWEAIVCGQDRPLHVPDDPRILFLTHDETRWPTPPGRTGGAGDKRAKRLQSLDHMERTLRADGYAWALDADDILHPGVVEALRTIRPRGGCLVESGLKLDLGSGAAHDLGPRPWLGPPRTPFWSTSGSGAALYFDLRPEGRLGTRLLRLALVPRHRTTPILATLAGFRPEPLAFPAGLYLVNNGSNVSGARLPGAAGRTPEQTRLLEEEFGWPEIAAEAEARFRPDGPDPGTGAGGASSPS